MKKRKKFLLLLLSLLFVAGAGGVLTSCIWTIPASSANEGNSGTGGSNSEITGDNSNSTGSDDTDVEISAGEGLAYALNDDGKSYSVAGIGTETKAKIAIPSTYAGLPVTAIRKCAFSGYTALTRVTIPDGITAIDEGAFEYCTALESIAIPTSVTTIGKEAFYHCSDLTSVTIGENVTSIGEYAFYGCSSLTGVYITDMAAWCRISFGYNYSNPLHYAQKLYLNGEPVTELVIPEGVTSIGIGAFEYCSGFTSIIIPESVTSIGYQAFRRCSGVTDIKMPGSVTSIGVAAFDGCIALTSITIPKSVTTVETYAFASCSSLESITVEAGNPVYRSADNCIIERASRTLIAGCKNSIIPNDGSVTVIGSSAFEGCAGLTIIALPESVTEIEYGSFIGCRSLTSITIPKSVTTIQGKAFDRCNSLAEVYYKGTAADWDSITIGNDNTSLTDTTKYYYSETEPTEEGNYWHYVDDTPAVWAKEG